MTDDFPCCKPLEPQRLWAMPEPEPVTDWQRLAVLQTERAHLIWVMEQNGISPDSDTSPVAKRCYALNKAIKEGIGNV